MHGGHFNFNFNEYIKQPKWLLQNYLFYPESMVFTFKTSALQYSAAEISLEKTQTAPSVSLSAAA